VHHTLHCCAATLLHLYVVFCSERTKQHRINSEPLHITSALTWCAHNRQSPLAAGQPQVGDLDLPTRAVDQDVITLEVSVHDGWVVCVQVQQALQDLEGPALDGLLADELVLFAVPAKRKPT
jgi:hypothetical protein